MSESTHIVGVDVGGTFTDLIAFGEGGALHSAKVPSIPGEQWRGVLDALASLGVAPESLRAFVHGTTIATNALLERKGARTGLVTTEGFRDLLEIGKGRRLVGGLFDPEWQRPAPLVPRDRRFEVPERLAADGQVVRPIDGFDFDALAAALARRASRRLRSRSSTAISTAVTSGRRPMRSGRASTASRSPNPPPSPPSGASSSGPRRRC